MKKSTGSYCLCKQAGIITVLLLSMITATVANAATVTVFGSDTAGAYSLTGHLVTPATPVATTQPASVWAPGSWMSPQPDQSWPMDAGSGNLPGIYDYSTTFDLIYLIPASAVLGTWAVDNFSRIILNGVEKANNSGVCQIMRFYLIVGFIPSTNTLDFKVTNDPYVSASGLNPTGLQVNFTQATANTPIPPALFLFASGLMGLYGVRRRKSV